MKTYLKLAWRNLWRNKKRSLITISSIFFAVLFSVFMSSFQKGSLHHMVENMVRFYSGYIQIQDPGFKSTPSINNTLSFTPELESSILKNKHITHYSQRIESFALSASGEKSYGCAVAGIVPEKEDKISNLSRWITEGSFLKNGDKGVLLGKDLADKLDLDLYDTLALIGQGYHGVSAAGLFEVTGILDLPIPEMNSNLLYMDLENCRDLFSIPERSTSVVIMVDDPDVVDEISSELQAEIADQYKVYTWREILSEIENFIAGKLASGKIIKGILFMVITFGIWGTVIMLMAERKREFGIMIALGVKKKWLSIILLFETVLIGIIGIIASILVSLPLIWYFAQHPIKLSGEVANIYREMGFEPVVKFGFENQIFVSPSITVLIIFILIFIHPLLYLKNLNTSNALRA